MIPSKGGVNIVGHFSSSTGLGNCASLFRELLVRNGYAVACLDVDCLEAPNSRARDEQMVQSLEMLPYDLNLIVVSMLVLPSLWTRRARQLLSPRFRNIGLIFWEQDRMPAAWHPSLAMFDSALVCSHFVEEALRSALPAMPVFYNEHPLHSIDKEVNAAYVRGKYGIPADALTFISNFDPRSDIARKNPAGPLQAFLRAFPHDDNVHLVLKTNSRLESVGPHPELVELRSVLTTDRRIHLVAETMSHDEAIQLYGACDVNVSLHRSEGLGLGPLECMMQGKLVVATGYSGNMSFMTEQNSLPVPFTLVTPTKASWQYMPEFAGSAARWAEPDIEASAVLLRWCRDHPDERRALGERGRSDALAYQARAWEGRGLRSALDAASAARARPFRRARIAQVLLQEVRDPVLRRLNMAAVNTAIRR